MFIFESFVDLLIVLGKGERFVFIFISLGGFLLVDHVIEFIVFSFFDFDSDYVIDLTLGSTVE